MAKRDRERERARQRSKYHRRKERQRDWVHDASLSETERETAQRLADQFAHARGLAIKDMVDHRRNTVTRMLEARERWEREHGERIASYAYRHVDSHRVENLFRQRYASTRKWYQPWQPPEGPWSDYVLKEILVCVLIVVTMVTFAWQWMQ